MCWNAPYDRQKSVKIPSLPVVHQLRAFVLEKVSRFMGLPTSTSQIEKQTRARLGVCFCLQFVGSFIRETTHSYVTRPIHMSHDSFIHHTTHSYVT